MNGCPHCGRLVASRFPVHECTPYFPMAHVAEGPHPVAVSTPKATLKEAQEVCDTYRKTPQEDRVCTPTRLFITLGFEGPVQSERSLITEGSDTGFWTAWHDPAGRCRL